MKTDLHIVGNFVLYPRHYANRQTMLGYACVSVCSGGRVAATPVPVQVRANAWTTEQTLSSQGCKTLQGFTGQNDLVPHQCKREWWDFWIANFSSRIKVKLLSTIYVRKWTFDESKTHVQKIMYSDDTAQYQSPWNKWLTEISFWLPGTLTVLNVFDGLVLGVRGFLYPREVDFHQGDSQWW